MECTVTSGNLSRNVTQNKYENTHPAGLLQPLPIPSQIWTDILIDFIEGLPNPNGYTFIMVVVDWWSKYAHFVPVSHPYTATKIAELFVINIFKLHGMPTSFVTDRDLTFISHFWKELFKLQGTVIKFSSNGWSSRECQQDGGTIPMLFFCR